MRLWKPAALALLAWTFIGCDSTPATPELHPVSGRVVRDGQPVQDGGLIFVPEGFASNLIVNGSVRRDGSFTVNTERTLKDGPAQSSTGAPLGTYKVIYHPASNGATMGLDVEIAERVTVIAGVNEFEVKLPKEMPKGAGIERDDNPEPKPTPKK